ncbi:aminomethyltransferase family protein [Halopelagius fulvigenes]|uniref:Aminomethyltransferase family protein n=1 Tax=Halopelagius fulvigenes TaxID=1198324 RepID=A0ABD5U6M9_9EURY
MTVVEELHAAHGATFEERGGRRVVRDYGRPAVTHRAVRNGAGIVEMGYGVVVVEGDDRIEFVDNAVSNRVPDDDGEGVYALLLDPQGRVETDMYVYNAGERLLCFTPPDRAEPLADDWAEKVFIQDVSVREASGEFGVFGVHGPQATEKVASVLKNAAAPEPALTFDRGVIGGEGVTVIANDGLTGDEGYEVVCTADAAERVFDTLITQGSGAAPFGYATWESLTAEAGTPLFETELAGRLPNVLGVRNAVDFEKGCFVGQEVVSKVENRGQPSSRLVGLAVEELPATGDAVLAGGDEVGEVTRAAEGPSVGTPIALAVVEYDLDPSATLSVRVGEETVGATRETLPFYEGSAVSARVPTYLEDEASETE